MSDSTVKLVLPENTDKNIEAVKYYTFNQTGNIMMSSTVGSGEVEESVRKVFSEVSVFFAAMSRSISTTKNPATGENYSLYNYQAIERVIDGSGLFVHVTETDVTHKTHSVGVDFSKELIQGLLGLATGVGSLAFASAMMAAIGKEGLSINASSSDDESKVGNIVFVCEYLMGMPVVSAIVVYADCKKHKQALSLGPCFKEEKIETNWEMHKDTYLFVTPEFIRTYSKDLSSIGTDPNYMNFINWLQGLVNRRPWVTGVYEKTDNDFTPVSGESLETGKNYVLMGQFLPAPVSESEWSDFKLKFDEQDESIDADVKANWSETEISFSISQKRDKKSGIGVYHKGVRILGTTGSYVVNER